MHPAYKCDVCDRSFNTEEECLAHEDEHKIFQEMALTGKGAKFNPEDIVKLKNGDPNYQELFVIQERYPVKIDDCYGWTYELSNYSQTWRARAENIELVMKHEEYVQLQKDLNEVLKKHNKKLRFGQDTYIDGHPCLEIVYNEKC